MALIEQSYIQSLLRQCDADFGRQEKQAIQAVNNRLDEIYLIFKKNTKQTFLKFSLEIIVRFMELSVEIQSKFKYVEEFVELFFERVTAPSQFYIRTLLVKAIFIAYKGHRQEFKGQAMINILKESLEQISKALNLITGPPDANSKGKDSKGCSVDPNKARYNFLVYNASTCLYKITRFMLRQHWQKNFTDIYERIYKLFEEFDEPDQNWRCRFGLILFQCLYDNDKKPDAFKILDLLWQRVKNKNCDILDSLFRLRVHLSKQNGGLAGTIKKDIEGADPHGWKILQVLQRMKSGAIPEAQVQKQLMGVVNQISLGVLSTNQQTASVTLSHIMQQRLAEAGRIALKLNIISIASSITNFLAKVRQPSQKAMVLNEYNKAELEIKKRNEFIDKKTGMIMSSSQIKELQIQNRKEALKTLQKVMLVNRKLNNADLIYEGAVLIWNLSLPFMAPQYRNYIAKSFDVSVQLLEQIDSIDHDLRSKMHLQLAKIYFGNQQMFHEVEKNIMKAIKLDHSIPVNKLQFKFQPEQDPSLYHRPYERYLNSYREKIMLKAMENMDPHELDTVVNDLWNLNGQKSQTARLDTLQKCLRTLLNMEDEKFVIDQSKMLVEEEIKEEKILFEQKKLRLYKKKKMLAAEVAEFAFEWELNDFAKKACEFVLDDTWEGKNSIELIIVQAKCRYFLGQIYLDEVVQENCEVAFAENMDSQAMDNGVTLSVEKKAELNEKKKIVFTNFQKGLQLAESIQQNWLVFNGGIYIWNNFLHIFRNPVNDSKIHPELVQLLKKFFETMKNSLKDIESKNIVYYDLDTKNQVFANIGLTYARIMEGQKQSDQVLKVCEALLVTQLSPHTRKMTNNMKARITNGKGGAAGGKDQKKGGKDVPSEKGSGFNDSFLLDIFSQLQIIQNSTNKTEAENLIKKCMETLETWKPKDKDEMELQLNAELWARLSRLAVNQETTLMYKIAIKCSNYSLSYVQTQKKISSIPSNRLRWYSLSEFLYAESLLKIANPNTQDLQSYEKLMFTALDHGVQAAHKGFRASINALVIDGAKQVWNICSKLQGNQKNRAKLLLPIKSVLSYIKEMREDSEPDLILLLAQLFFKAANQNNENKMGEEVADMLFSLVPKNLQKSIWEAKMVFMSKQGKNELQAISNMKEADPSLQAKLWIKLARISNNPKKQYAAYNKAIEILKKQSSIEIVEVLIEYGEWQLRVGRQKVKTVTSTLLLASDYLIDIQYGQDEEDEDDEVDEDRGTVFSRSTRGKKSHASKSIKSSVKGSKVTKKSVDKKVSSYKKNSSNQSRMSRSGRAVKVNKSKNAKSIFSHREEDPNPQSLNCIHFERLFRIHTILAMIAQNPTNRIRYALDAKQFLLKILELSLKTVNSIQENAAKFADKSNQNPQKLRLPETAEEWINFDLSTEFLSKVKILEDANFMGTYSFQKPELTLAYMKHLSHILTSYGLDLHNLSVIFFKKYIAKHIINNQSFLDVAQLENILCLNKIGYNNHENPQMIFPQAEKYKLTEVQIKQELIRSKSKIVEDSNDNQMLQNTYSPKLVKPFSVHEAWFEIGKCLVEFGEVQPAKIYINEALRNFQILNNIESSGEACIYLLKIALFEGETHEGMQNALLANKLCKSIQNWEILLLNSSKLLLSLRKYDDLASFAQKIYEVVGDLVQSLGNGNEEKQIFESEIVNIKDLLILIQLIDLKLRFTQSTQEQLPNPTQIILKAIAQIEKRFEADKIWKISHYKYFHEIATEILNFFIFGKEKQFPISQLIFKRILELLLKVQKAMFELMKYTLIEKSPDFNSNSLIAIYKKIRMLIVQSFNYEEMLGDIANLNEKSEEVESEKSNKLLKKYFETLNIEIQKKLYQGPMNMSPAEYSLSILANLKPKTRENSYEFIEWQSLNIRALTEKAKTQGCFRNHWIFTEEGEQQEPQKREDNEEKLETAAQSLQAIYNFVNENYEEKVLNFSENTKCFELGRKLYEAFVENTGQQFSEGAFKYLCKLQHCSYTSKILAVLKKNLHPSHKFNSILSLLENSQISKNEISKIIESNKLFNSILNFPKFDDCLSLIPRNGIYVILQMSNDCKEIYYGCLIHEKQGDQYGHRYIMKKKSIQLEELQDILGIKSMINKVKREISYFAYDDDEKMVKAIEEKEVLLQKMMKKLKNVNQWWLSDLVKLVTEVKETQAVPDADKNKKGGKDTKKKGKDDVAAYESPLGASPAGFESITFLLDDIFHGLPLNLLNGLECIPAISFNNSIFYLSRKMQVMGYKADANNSNGFGLDKGKYISYDFRKAELGFKELLNNIQKTSPSLKFEGINSNIRIPSLGDYSKYISEPGYLVLHGSIDFLNYMKLPILLSNVGQNKCKLIIINDRLNYRKSLLNKFKSLDQKSFSNSIEDEEMTLNIITDLLDISMIKNRWTGTIQSNNKLLNKTLENLGSGNYLGAINFVKPEEVGSDSEGLLYERMSLTVFGSPVIRL